MTTIFGSTTGMSFFSVVFFLIGSIELSEGKSNAFVEDRKCGVFYSEKDYSGNEFVLKDFDQSVNTRKDYRASTSGWHKTGSIQIEQNCTMNVCTGIYFQGTCHSLTAGHHQNAQLMANINSANCTCARECTCEDLHIPKSYWSCGRAFPRNACNKCDSEYFHLNYQNRWWNFPSIYAESVERLVLRTGCNLTIWTEWDKLGERKVISGNTDPGRFQSYQCACDDTAFVPPERPNSYPPLVELPETKEQLISLLSSNLTAAIHPGLQAAFTSTKKGRSSRSAYIILIGTFYPDDIGLKGCSGEFQKISECHFPVDLDELGVSNAQLRIIYANVGGLFTDLGKEHYNRWAATLADYLSNHEDLKDSVPNAVILYHWPMHDYSIAEQNSEFQRKLKFLDSLRPLIVDENYSNIIFYLSNLDGLPAAEQRNPEERIKKFEEAIRGKWAFPEPTVIISRSLLTLSSHSQMINGHWRMPNGEYALGNLQESLKLISEKGGDPLGYAIFDAAYPFERQQKGVDHKTVDLLPSNHSQVELYQQFGVDPVHLSVRNMIKIRKLETQCGKLRTKIVEENTKLENWIQNLKAKLEEVKQTNEANIQQITAEMDTKLLAKEDVIVKEKMQQIRTELYQEIRAKEELAIEMEEKMQELLATGFDKEKLAREADIERIQKEIWEKIKLDLNKLFE